MTDWDDAGPELLAGALRREIDELEGAVGRVQSDVLASGRVTPEHVTELRTAIDGIQSIVEGRMAPMAGREPWGDVLAEPTYGQLAEALGVSIDDVNRLRKSD